MFVFYHSQQDEQNRNYYKGILFEKLLGNYLSRLGYTVRIRTKKNSLEYDIDGTDIPTGLKLIGEAKAYERNIAGQVLSAFVGKLIPLGLIDKEIKGLFLSTSPLTPEADDYYQSIKKWGVRSITSRDLFMSMLDTFKFPSVEQIRTAISSKGYIVQAEYILSTDAANFLAIVSVASHIELDQFCSLI